MVGCLQKANNSGSQVPLTLHPNFPTLSLRKTSGLPRPVGVNLPGPSIRKGNNNGWWRKDKEKAATSCGLNIYL